MQIWWCFLTDIVQVYGIGLYALRDGYSSILFSDGSILLHSELEVFTGALKTRDWKTRHQITGVENAGPENGGTSKLWKAVAVENVQHS